MSWLGFLSPIVFLAGVVMFMGWFNLDIASGLIVEAFEIAALGLSCVVGALGDRSCQKQVSQGGYVGVVVKGWHAII